MTERVVVTTIVRCAPLEIPGGRLRVVDLASRSVVADAPLPDALHRARDPNPRGGLRGGRGAAAAGDRLAVALNDRVLLLDHSWAIRGVVSHRFIGGLHDIAADARGIWVACADNDAVLRFDWDGRLVADWTWRGEAGLRRALGHGWLPSFDRRVDHRDPLGAGVRVDIGHVNAVAVDGDAILVGLGLHRPSPPLWWRTVRDRALVGADRVGLGRGFRGAHGRWRGTAYAAVGRQPDGAQALAVTPGALWRAERAQEDTAIVLLRVPADLRAGAARIVARLPGGRWPAHNVLRHDGLLVVNDSDRGEVVGVDPDGRVVRRVSLSGRSPFPRGLLELGGGRVLVGRQGPAALEVVNLDEERVEARVDLGGDDSESPYAIAPGPGSFDDPAGRLPASRAGWGLTGGDARAARPPGGRPGSRAPRSATGRAGRRARRC